MRIRVWLQTTTLFFRTIQYVQYDGWYFRWLMKWCWEDVEEGRLLVMLSPPCEAPERLNCWCRCGICHMWACFFRWTLRARFTRDHMGLFGIIVGWRRSVIKLLAGWSEGPRFKPQRLLACILEHAPSLPMQVTWPGKRLALKQQT